jgi:hypothetical protein
MKGQNRSSDAVNRDHTVLVDRIVMHTLTLGRSVGSIV